MDPPYAKDANRAYAGAVAMEINDPKAFEVVWKGGSEFPLISGYQELNERENQKPRTSIWGWARDGVDYYHADAKMIDADYKSFQVLNLLHAKDKNNVYYAADRSIRIIRGADPATFKLIEPSSNRGRDKSREYVGGEPVIKSP